MFLIPKKISPLSISPNFIIGYGRAIDIAASLSKIPANSENYSKDIEAIAYDWKTIGNDMFNSIAVFNEQNNK